MKKYLFNKVVLIGVGLIGGSLGRDLFSKKIAREVCGIDVSLKTLSYAQKHKVISEIVSDEIEALQTADLIVFATPVKTLVEQLLDFAPFISKTALVIDVGSTKTEIMKKAKLCFPYGNFVGCHPMAGSEQSGVQASQENLFAGSPCLLVTEKNTTAKARKRALALWTRLGARVVAVDLKHHDVWLSACSHLPHALSYAVMHSVGKKIGVDALKKIAGRSFKSYTRIAGSDARMWTDIFLDNSHNTLKQLAFFQKEIKRFEKAIRDKDERWLFSYMSETKKLWKKM